MKNISSTELRIQKARTALLLDHPFFGSLLFRLKGRESRSIATMATDGVSLYYNSEFVDTLNSATLCGVLAHEVMHPALHHHVRRSGRNPRRWNEACDYAINPLLLDAGLSLPDGVLVDSRFRQMSAEQIYNQLENEAEQRSRDEDGANSSRGCGTGVAPPAESELGSEPGSESGSESDGPSAPVTEGGIGQVLDAPLPDEETPSAPTHREMLRDERSHFLPFCLSARGSSADRDFTMHQSRLHTGQALRGIPLCQPSAMRGLRHATFERHKLCRGLCAWQ